MVIEKQNTKEELFGAIIYSVGLFVMFCISSLYHAFPYGSRVKRLFRRFDYSSIYLLIGATFAPILLAYIGGKMIYEVIRGGDDETVSGEYKLDVKELFVLAIATSIDALAVGVIFAAQKTNLILSVSVIAAITFVVCLAGVVIGNRFGSKYEKKAELAGGIVLVIIGIKLLIDGLVK